MLKMSSIDDLVFELNEILKQYIDQNGEFEEATKLQAVITEIKNLGYNIATPLSGPMPSEGEILSEEGKYDYKKMIDARKMKIEAVNVQDFERAAELRDVERALAMKISIDFWKEKDKPHMVLTGKISDMVVFDNSNSRVILFK